MTIELLNDSFTTVIQLVPDMSREQLRLLVKQEAICNCALQDWIDQRIDDDTFLDILEANGHKMDEYLKTVDSNLDYLGV